MNRRTTPGHVRLRDVAVARLADIAPATVCAVLRQVAFLSIPFALQRALDGGVVVGDTGVAARWGAVVVGLGIVQSLLMAGWTYWVNLADVRTCGDLRSAMTSSIAGLDRYSLSAFGQGDLVLRATRDVEVIGTWVHGLPALAVIAATFGYVLPQLLLLDVTLLLVALAMLPVVVGVTLYHRPRFADASEGLSLAHGTRADAVEDLLAAGATVRGLGGESELVRRHHERSGALALATMTAARSSAAWQSQGASVPRLAIAVGLLAGGGAVLDGRLTVGGLVAFASWMLALEMATRVLVERLSDRGRALVAARRIDEVLDVRRPLVESSTPTMLPERGTLTARGIVMSPGAPPVDLDVPPGTLMAVTGPVAAGKSTLLSLLARARDPLQGTVAFGGVPLTEASLADVAARVMLVAQRPRLLSGTLRECLLGGGAVEVGDAALHAACRVAVLDEVVHDLPLALDTVVGERGTTLSGGQVQRLAVARAIVRSPAVLLLDDVTSALDTATEAELLRRLRVWAGQRRVVVAATHRAGVLAAADVVLHLRAGRVVENMAATRV